MKQELKNILFKAIVSVFFSANQFLFSQVKNSTKQNVVVFLVDDLGSGEVACYGSKFHETPNIDALAKNGIKFTKAYSGATLCSPSRAAFLTGRSPARLHLTDWIPGQKQINRRTLTPDWQTFIDKDRLLLPEAMKQNGYSTAFFGKWHLVPRPTPIDMELNDLVKLKSISKMYDEHMPEKNGFDENYGGDHSPNQGGRFLYPKFRDFPGLAGKGTTDDCLTDILTDCAVDYLDRKKDEPFFLYMSYYTVHTPITGKPDYVKKYQKKLADNPNRDYYMKNPRKAAMMLSLDESVGRIVAKLKQIGQLDNTLIIFTGDNGSQGNEFVPNYRGNKGTAYEGGVRVPLIISGPGINKGIISNEPTIAMDFYPTILESIGLETMPDEHLDGISIVPALKSNAKLPKRNFYWHYPHYDETTPYSSILSGDWKLIKYLDDNSLELYNLALDPMESLNLIDSYPEKREEMVNLLNKELNSVNAQPAILNPNFDPNKFSGGIREYRRVKGRS